MLSMYKISSIPSLSLSRSSKASGFPAKSFALSIVISESKPFNPDPRSPVVKV